jgi:TonB family protein
MISDKGIHRIAIILSVLIHIFLIIILIINSDKTKITPSEPIVIEYKIKEIIVKKPSPIIKPKPKKPTSLPGDRKKAIATKKLTPFYPKDAINYSLEGTVRLKVTINKTGIVSTIKILKSSGHKSLDNAFIDTIMNSYKFKPKRKMGKNKVDNLILEYTFKL